MLTGVHFLLSYSCPYECDHCFLYCSPRSEGTFTGDQIRNLLDQSVETGTVDTIYFEGGEPFLFYPLLVMGVGEARDRGLKVGIVTNGYWATSVEDAILWLRDLVEAGIEDFSVSEDEYHTGDQPPTGSRYAREAAEKLGLPMRTICIDPPRVHDPEGAKGSPIVAGGAVMRGRAVDKLAPGLPCRSANEFTECRLEELRDPGRVHVDCFGHVQVCQGLSMGNVRKKPLGAIMREYVPDEHPIVGPLLRGGPLALAERYGIQPRTAGYVDECHFCYSMRRQLLERFPEYLSPRQVYGDSDGEVRP